MKLEKFIEKDMQEFLDLKANERKEESPGMVREDEMTAFDLSRDYEEKADQALEKGQLDEARQIFVDLKEEYNTFPENSTDQKKAYYIMKNVWNKISDYLEQNPVEKEPDTPEELGINLPEKPGKEKEEKERKPPKKPKKPGIEETPDKESDSEQQEREQQIENIKEQRKRKEELVESIRTNIDRIEKLLDKKDVYAAVILYRNIKEDFRKIPERFENARKEIYDEIITCYYQIRKTADQMEDEKVPEQLQKDTSSQDKKQETQDISQKSQKPEEESKKTTNSEDQQTSTKQEETNEKSETPQKPTPPPGVDEPEKDTSSPPTPDEESKKPQKPPKPPSKKDSEPETPNQEPKPPQPEQPQQETPRKQSKPSKESVLSKLEEMKNYIRNKQPKKAHNQYKKVQKEFEKLDLPNKEKEELFKDIVAAHHSLKELEDHIMEKNQSKPPEKSNFEREKEQSTIEKIRQGKIKAHRYLDKDAVESAIAQYNKLTDLFEQIPDEKQDEKERQKRDLMDLHDQIVKAKKDKMTTKEDYETAKNSSCWEDVQKVKDLIRRNEVDKAQNAFIDLQKRVRKVEDDEERKELYNTLDNIKSKLHLANTSKNMQDRKVRA